MKKKIRICIVYDALTKQHIGALKSTLRFADKLRKKGHEIIFIAAKYPGTSHIDRFMGYKVYRFRAVMLPFSEQKFYLSFPSRISLKRIFRKERIDVLHLMIPSPSAVSAADAAKDLSIKIVAHSHTQPENLTINLPHIMQAGGMHSLLYSYILWIYRKAGVVICPSRFAENLLKKRYPRIKTKVISNGVDISFFRNTTPDSFMKRFGLSKEKKRLLFVGRLHPEKNVELLIRGMPRILSRMSNVELCIIGVGYQENYLKGLSRKLGISQSTRFLHRIEDSDLPLAYSSCDIFVLPSLIELEGMVVLEAMACGKPILIADSPNSASPYFVSGNGLKFKPKNPVDFAEKALLMLGDESMLRDMARASLSASKLFDIERSVEMIEKVYESAGHGKKI